MRSVTFTQLLRETLSAELRRDPSVFLMGEDIGVYGGSFGVTRGLIDEFGPERVRDTPISEQALTGVAIGAAVAGQRPVIEIMFMDFITLAVDQLVNMAAKLHPIYGRSCPLVIRTPPGGGRGYGATHSQSLERLFTGIPGLKIVAPSNATDASALLQTAIRDNNPVLFLEHKLLYPQRFEVDDNLPAPLPFGFARTAREGDDLTMVAWSHQAFLAERAAAQLAAEGIDAEVIDLRTLCPLDIDTLVESARRTGRVMILEEGPKTGGFAAEIAAQIMEQAHEYLEKPIRRIAGADFPIPSAKNLEAACLPAMTDILALARSMVDN
ncbi:MAG TPA: alpha-ketoacid dehydrogenase subunit beta [Kiritimatiellia bacterium]|nr:alpha-ketoacid dehydrogenase subunit beta [Kiritimatiellia bacterium]HRU71314.1 alpha-ketoacid dehydrogenase subunit beta [Kiritimatiellia bacterium]